MPVETHLLMDGALHVYRRENSRYWQGSCAFFQRLVASCKNSFNVELVAISKAFIRNCLAMRAIAGGGLDV